MVTTVILSTEGEQVKHTSGPWNIVPFSDGHAFVYDADMAFVANVATGAESGEANARLIAAAPDMLAALKTASNWIAAQGAYPETSPTYEKVLFAIAKAEGRTP